MSGEPLRPRREQTERDRRRPSAARRTYQTAATLQAPLRTPTSRAALTWRGRLAGLTVGWDYPLLAILAIMLAYGLVMVFSASYASWGVALFLRQLQWIGIGLVGMTAAAVIPIRFWQRLAIPIMIVALIALAAVLFFGDYRFGSRRTFSGTGSIQPSEFAKLAVIIYVATWVASKGRALADTRAGLIPFAILMGLVGSLIALEPNLSTTIVVLVIGIVIFFVGGADVKQMLVVGLIGGFILGLLVWQTPHAQERVLAWWNTLADPELAPESTRHALELMRRRDGLVPDMAVWNQKRLVALLWSDYLFANIGADLGPLGQLAVVILYAALGYRCLGIALRATGFGALAIVGVTTWILTQATMHIGTSIVLIPATGQTLPFMSYGGSAMIALLTAVGLVLRVAHESPEKRASDASFAIGRGDRRARVPDPGRRGRAEAQGDTRRRSR